MNTYVVMDKNGIIEIVPINPKADASVFAEAEGASSFFVVEREEEIESPDDYIIDFTNKTLFRKCSLEYKMDKYNEFLDLSNQISKEIKVAYPELETDAWPDKVRAANAYLANSASPIDKIFIEDEALAFGVTPSEYANSIIAKATGHATLVSKITIARNMIERLMQTAMTKEEFDTKFQEIMDKFKTDVVMVVAAT